MWKLKSYRCHNGRAEDTKAPFEVDKAYFFLKGA